MIRRRNLGWIETFWNFNSIICSYDTLFSPYHHQLSSSIFTVRRVSRPVVQYSHAAAFKEPSCNDTIITFRLLTSGRFLFTIPILRDREHVLALFPRVPWATWRSVCKHHNTQLQQIIRQFDGRSTFSSIATPVLSGFTTTAFIAILLG